MLFLRLREESRGGRYRPRDFNNLKRGNVANMTVNIANVIIILEFFYLYQLLRYSAPVFAGLKLSVKESHRFCCHGPLALLAMRDSGTSTVFTRIHRIQDIRLWFRQSERTTARDLVQQKIHPYYREINTEDQQRWTRWWYQKVINKRRDYIGGT